MEPQGRSIWGLIEPECRYCGVAAGVLPMEVDLVLVGQIRDANFSVDWLL